MNPRHRNPSLGPMMEGFSGLLKGARNASVYLEGTTPDGKPYTITLQRGRGDHFDILRMKVGNRIVAAAQGRLGWDVFAEHSTFTLPAARGKGYMRFLYECLLAEGIGIRSDLLGHSLPMRRVWMALARSGFVFVQDRRFDATGCFIRVRGDDVDDPLLDRTLFAAPGTTLKEAEAAMPRIVREAVYLYRY